jgi:hypothetical protein
MKKLALRSFSIALAVFLIIGLINARSQEKEKEKKSLEKSVSITKDKKGEIITRTKIEDIDEKLSLEQKTFINVKMELLEIRPSETKLISSPVVRVEDGKTAQFLMGSEGKGSFHLEVTPTIIERKGIEIKVNFKKEPEMKNSLEKTVLALNSQPLVIELFENKAQNSKLAVKITPLVDVKGGAREYPGPINEVRFVQSFLIMNNDRLIARGDLLAKGGDGEIIPYFYVQGKGIYVLSFRPFEGAEPKGLISGKIMKIKLGEDEFEWLSQEPILPEGTWLIWVRNNPNFLGYYGVDLYLEAKNGLAGVTIGKDSWKKFFK